MLEERNISENIKHFLEIFDNHNKTGYLPIRITEVPSKYEYLADEFEYIGFKMQSVMINLLDQSYNQDTIDEFRYIISSMFDTSNIFRNMSENMKNNSTEYIGNHKIIINNQEESETHISNTNLLNERKTMCGMHYELVSRRSGKVASIYELSRINPNNNNLCNLCYSVYVTTMDSISVK